MSASEYLHRVNEEYRRLAGQYKGVAREAALAEAHHKAQRAKKILVIKDANPGMSHAEAVTRAEADDEIAALHQDRLLKDGLRDSLKEKLHQMKEEVPSARTGVVNERTVDDFHSRGYSGAA